MQKQENTKKTNSHLLEESRQLILDFNKLKQLGKLEQDLLPVIVQDANNFDVLLLAYTNRLALEESIKTKQAVFWSTSRNQLWIKGAVSGDYLDMVEIRVNCEQNSLLYLVTRRTGKTCHTKDAKGLHRPSCFYRQLNKDQLDFIP